MARKNRQAEGLNLAFLDIMSCGLGAVILVFMLVKQHIDSSSSEVEQLQQDISQLEQARDEAQQNLDKLGENLEQQTHDLAAMGESLKTKQANVGQQTSAKQQAESDLEAIKKSITQIEVPDHQADQLQSPQVNEQNYLMGLKVQGQKIAILVDTSASMTNEKLLDIIKTKSGSQQGKTSAPKWKRTQRVVEWLLARTPKNSQIAVIGYNENSKQLGGSGWMPASQAAAVVNSLKQVVPEGATNLQKALNMVNTLSPSNIYVVTDGLPTQGESNYKSLNPFSGCNSLTGSDKTISGECRLRLFAQTLNESASRHSQVDVILLPLEGDPDAAYAYWNWASSTGGLLISPASNWP